MANLDQIANFVADNFDSMTTTVLFDSSTKHTSGTISIPTIADYDALVVYTKTNTEYFADIIFLDSNLGVGQNITYTKTVSSYTSWIIMLPLSSGLYVSSQSSNPNWILGVIKIVGIKFAGKH